MICPTYFQNSNLLKEKLDEYAGSGNVSMFRKLMKLENDSKSYYEEDDLYFLGDEWWKDD